MILRFLFYAFLIYMLYKLVFDFIIPIYRTTKQVKKGFREMNERMRQAEGFPNQSAQAQKPRSEESRPGEYIDFEEVKD